MWRAALVFLLVVLVIVGALMVLRQRPGPLPKNFKPRPWKDDKEDDEW